MTRKMIEKKGTKKLQERWKQRHEKVLKDIKNNMTVMRRMRCKWSEEEVEEEGKKDVRGSNRLRAMILATSPTKRCYLKGLLYTSYEEFAGVFLQGYSDRFARLLNNEYTHTLGT